MSTRRLDLKVGFACNNRCVFCAQGTKRAICGALPPGRLAHELVQGRKSAGALVLTGGEPTVHKHILGIVRLAHELGYAPIQLQTNARMLAYPRTLKALVDAGVTEIAPSLHGATADVHDALTGAAGSFEQSVNGIRNVVALGLPMITNSVVTQRNLSTLAEIVELLGLLGASQAQLAFVHPVGSAYELFDQVVPHFGDLEGPLTRARSAALACGIRLVTEAVPLCFLRGMDELAVEARIPETTVADLEGGIDYSAWRVAEGKVHGPPCAACSARHRCEGPWREYPERRGWQEFSPL